MTWSRRRGVPGRAGEGGSVHSIRSRGNVAILAGLVMVASAPRSAPGEGQPLRAIAPDEITWSTVAGYPPGYGRAMLEGEADKPVPFTYRVRLPAGFTFQPHTHATDEHVTVLQGAWSFGVGNTFEAARLRSFPAGSFVVIPAGTPHFIATDTDTIVQVHGVGPIGFRFVGDPGSGPRR